MSVATIATPQFTIVPGTTVTVMVCGSQWGVRATNDSTPTTHTEANPAAAATAAKVAVETIASLYAEGSLPAKLVAARPHHDWFNAPGRPATNLAPAVQRGDLSAHLPVPPAQDPSAPLWQHDRRVDAAEAIRRAAVKLPTTDTAYYALNEDGTWKFYRVDQPQEGRWAGYVFVKIQASDDFHNIRNLTRAANILEAIVARGAKAAMQDYGHQLGRCGMCHRTLTDPASIEAGIGPVCAAKF